jgi:hypothetical protein
MGLPIGPWTPEENDRLIAMVAKGASVVRATAAFDRTIVNVRSQALKFGAPFRPNRIARLKWAAPPKR